MNAFGEDFFELVKTGTPEQARKSTNPEIIKAMLKAGANARIISVEGKIAFDYAEQNEKVKGTDAYWELKRATFLSHVL